LGATYNDGVTPPTDWVAITEVMVYYDDADGPLDADKIVLDTAPVEVVVGADSRINITGHFHFNGSKVFVESYAIDLTNAAGDVLIDRIAEGFRSAEFNAELPTRDLNVGQYAIRGSPPRLQQ
jgi:hypothetical protein